MSKSFVAYAEGGEEITSMHKPMSRKEKLAAQAKAKAKAAKATKTPKAPAVKAPKAPKVPKEKPVKPTPAPTAEQLQFPVGSEIQVHVRTPRHQLANRWLLVERVTNKVVICKTSADSAVSWRIPFNQIAAQRVDGVETTLDNPGFPQTSGGNSSLAAEVAALRAEIAELKELLLAKA